MPPRPLVPPQLAETPFLARAAVSAGLLTPAMLRGPMWRRLFRGVYLHRAVEPDHRTWCRAAALWLPEGAAIGGASAGHLWVGDLRAATDPVTVVIPRTVRVPRNPRIDAHYTVIDQGEITRLFGIPLTTPERTAFDAGRRLPRAEALILLDALLRRRTLRAEELNRLVLDRHTWRGVQRLQELLRLADGRAESPMETRLRLLLIDEGLTPDAVC